MFVFDIVGRSVSIVRKLEVCNGARGQPYGVKKCVAKENNLYNKVPVPHNHMVCFRSILRDTNLS